MSEQESLTPLKLRPATLDDLDAIWAIESAVFASDAWSKSLLREELIADHRCYLVLESALGAVEGYGGLLLVGSEADVQTIAVTPAVRGTGQGRRLMLALIEEAAQHDATEMFLEVRADHPIPQALYASLGFAEIGIRPRYYQPDGVDAIVMRLDLKETR
ncbi:ribosomal protein S18-alanine N-acetyltransferase [Leucobacter luti]|uniref:ribosomal protein S18-alanine N-acetyltransferase n=1 Tax=Leucobacter luti TaxID=340320 RepID=UPI001C69062B|nr:ribosomal protein S18-alanine N-acetyltransferase [Leucobacter luti]QYM75504.1 ribosomal protein S18-alanine N-acetyltransferase [Leucobacter luti]